MRVIPTTDPPALAGADTVAAGVFGDGVPATADAPARAALGALLDRGEARRGVGDVALAHVDGRRRLLAGLGDRAALDAERARLAAAAVAGRARELGARTLGWELPDGGGAAIAAGVVEGTLLAAYRFDRYRSAGAGADRPGPEALVVQAPSEAHAAIATAAAVAEAQNAARDLANTPANDLPPQALAEHAVALAASHPALSVEVEGMAGIETRGMGAFAAVARGSDAEPALITLRHEPAAPAPGAPLLGLVGKAVTYDTGGLTVKPPASMPEMKYDMAGGAAVLEAVAAIARLELPVRIVAVVGAAENMISGRAMRPGDVARTRAGLTIQVDNPDAEGRLVLADCLTHAVELGAERLLDVATLTGGIRVALGRTYAGLMADDDAWAAQVEAAGRATGELVWRLPLHPEYAKLTEGTVADLTNRPEPRVASAITAAELLRRFTGDVPWAHLDVVGTAWDLGRAYAPTGASGFGVRLLVDLARGLAAG